MCVMPSHPIADHVGGNVRAEMGRQRITMVELARRTGISRGTLQGQINGGTLTVDNLVLIANALALEPADLLPESFEASA